MSLGFLCCQGTAAPNNGETLLQAVKSNDLQKVKFCLAESANGDNLTEAAYQEAFCEAAKNDNLVICKLLLEFGKFSPRFDGDRAIGEAGPECARWLMEMGLEAEAMNWESGRRFCEGGDLDLLKLVLPKFAAEAPNRTTALLELMETAGNDNRLDIIKYIYEQTQVRYDGEPSRCIESCVLGKMAEVGYLDCLKFLNELGHQESCRSPDALQRALQNGQHECAKYIIEHSVIDLRFEDDWVFTMALENCYWDIIIVLVGKGLPASICDNMAIKLAASSGNLEMVKFLVKAGANVEVNEGAPLIRAAEAGHLDLVKYILGDLKAKMRSKALLKAKTAGRTEVADYLAIIPIPGPSSK